uniref:Uncharacterized protein n=1 Tax=Rhizophora mucronata TaxID=61149 RepID=A0A2P2QW67_RHIMU
MLYFSCLIIGLSQVRSFLLKFYSILSPLLLFWLVVFCQCVSFYS